MIVFTFYDYQITNYLFNPGTIFGKTFEVLGPTPMPLFVIFSSISLLFTAKFKKIQIKVLTYIGIVLALVYAFAMGIMTFKYSYAPYLFIPSIILFTLLSIFTIYLNIRIKKKENEQLLRTHFFICLCIFMVSFSSLFGSDLIKCIFGRVRYINLTSVSDYYPWFHINKFDFNSSFPSGHASRSLSLICASFILFYFNKAKWSLLIEAISIAFALTVAYTRMLEGMHYPTDLITGLVITSLAYIISKNYLRKKINI